MASYFYLECENGVAGDMLVAALLDLGADAHRLMEVLQSLPLGGYEVRIDRVKKAGIDAMDFDVILDEDVDGHDHDMAYLHGGRGHDVYGSHRHEDWEGDPRDLPGHDGSGTEHFHSFEDHSHGHGHDHFYDHFYDHNGDHSHGHSDEYSRGRSDGHPHGHRHAHRRLPEIYDIIDAGRMTERARELAKSIFYIVAQSEAKAHAIPVEDVHFHEVGAVDSIVDIVSIAVCIDDLRIREFIVPYLCEGWGSVRCAHGVLPIPVPAVMAIAEAHRLPLKRIDVRGEFVTPTGAAAVAALRSDRSLPEVYTIKRMGIGAGKREYERPSLLRLYEIEAEPGSAPAAPAEAGTGTGAPKPGGSAPAASAEAGIPKAQGAETDEEFVWKLETNVDDITGEQLGYVMNLLFEAGARDVYFSPVQMKKGRPGIELVVICDDDHCRRMEDLLFMETTTIGIRKQRMQRRVLPRHTAEVQTAAGKVRAKEVTLPDGTVRIYSEYDEVIALARQKKMTYHDAWCEVVRGL